jgi:tRNA(His) guanylyltransferase
MDNLGDRMKLYEMKEAGRILSPDLPILVRIDGKAFHTFTKGLGKPYDEGLSDLMVNTTKYLVAETNATIGYTQSDEISLCLLPDKEPYLGARVQKLCSVLASIATAYFNRELPLFLPGKVALLPTFDARVWNVPTLMEVSNVFLWRELDATKNAISMTANTYFHHKVLHGKTCAQMQEMLLVEKGINFNDYPVSFKRGTYVRRITNHSKYSVEELEQLPPLHRARLTDLVVTRRSVEVVELPRLNTIANRVDVLLYGAEPITFN